MSPASSLSPIYPRILRCGDSAVCVEFSNEVSEGANLCVIALDQSLQDVPVVGVQETIPTYRSLTVIYEPSQIRGAELAKELERRAASLTVTEAGGRLLEVPVYYGGEHQGDIDDMAAMKGLNPQAILDIHAANEYRVFMIGFAPGFAYLGGLPEILHVPRLAVPRQRIEAGAIGIGGRQASINSVPGPSGWRFIGRTPFKLFQPNRSEPFLLKAGDRIRFKSITKDEAMELDHLVKHDQAELREIV